MKNKPSRQYDAALESVSNFFVEINAILAESIGNGKQVIQR